MLETLPQIYYNDKNNFQLLPEWAYCYMDLGYKLASAVCTGYRIVVGVSAPTRAFACCLVTTGIAIAKANSASDSDDLQIRHILSLKRGTSVHVRMDNNRKVRGVIEALKEQNGLQQIVIRTADAETRWFPLHRYASRITVAEHDVNIPEKQQRGRLLDSPSDFLQGCIGAKAAQNYILDSSFEALLVGKESFIRHEACDVPFWCNSLGKSVWAKGCLQDIMRVRSFSGANKSFRTQCMSYASDAPEKRIESRDPPIVVFDGAVAFLKHAQRFTKSHQIVLLDRTERQFTDAIALMNQNYAYRSDVDFKFPILIPDGIEMMIYWEHF
ncbi:MAG: hypothetical protein K8L91_21970 [Anaerolineae bacterium]|nr:hypothetical protein [Anaerolineae bacterium]